MPAFLHFSFFTSFMATDNDTLNQPPDDGRFIEVGLSQSFLEYGLWQDFGTGKEIPQGNHGDIGREKMQG